MVSAEVFHASAKDLNCRLTQRFAAQVARDTGRDANRKTVWGNRTRHDGACTDARSTADADTVEHDGAGADPAVVLDHDTFGGDPLVHDRRIWIGEHMIHRQNLSAWAEQHVVPDVDSALTPHDCSFTHKGPPPDSNARLRHVTKVEHMQPAAVHHPGARPDSDAAGTTVKVDPVVQID